MVEGSGVNLLPNMAVLNRAQNLCCGGLRGVRV